MADRDDNEEIEEKVIKVKEIPTKVISVKELHSSDDLEEEIKEEDLREFAEFVTGISSEGGTPATALVLERDTTAEQTVREVRQTSTTSPQDEVRNFYDEVSGEGLYSSAIDYEGKQHLYNEQHAILQEEKEKQPVSVDTAPSLQRRNISQIQPQSLNQFQQEREHGMIADQRDDKYSSADDMKAKREERRRYPWEF